MEDQTAPLGQKINERRHELGMSLDKLADASGVHKATLSRLESGAIRQPTAETLQRVAAALQVSATELFSFVGEGTRGALPPLQPYLRAKYDLPDEAIAEMTAYLDRYRSHGPHDGEDEQPEHY